MPLRSLPKNTPIATIFDSIVAAETAANYPISIDRVPLNPTDVYHIFSVNRVLQRLTVAQAARSSSTLGAVGSPRDTADVITPMLVLSN